MGNYVDAKTYVVAWMSFHDNTLKQEVITALNNCHALELSSQDLITLEDIHMHPTMDQLKDLAFDRDGLINVTEIKPA